MFVNQITTTIFYKKKEKDKTIETKNKNKQ
jgi:hypothetical protein